MRLLGVLVAVLAAVATYLSTVAIDGGPLDGARTAKVLLPGNGPVVKDGDDVRLSGVRVGQVRAVKLTPRGALATLAVGDRQLRAGTRARIQLRGLAGAVNVELEPGAGAVLADGALLGRARAGTGLTDVVAGFDADTRAALARTVRVAGQGLAGRGGTLNRALGDLAPALGTMTPVLAALRPAPGVLGDVVVQAGRLAAAVPREDLEQLVAAAAPTAVALAHGSDALGATVDAAPGLEAQSAHTLPAVDSLLDRLRPTMAVLDPGVRALAQTLPDLAAIEARGSALAGLARVGRAATPVVRRATPIVAALYPSVASLGALTDPLGRLATYLIPYGTELSEAPAGFTRWGSRSYDQGQGAGHKAVRFTMIFTCAKARNPYPKAGAAGQDRERCAG